MPKQKQTDQIWIKALQAYITTQKKEENLNESFLAQTQTKDQFKSKPVQAYKTNAICWGGDCKQNVVDK